MSKTKVDKKINKIVRIINRNLKEDVFGDRFWIRQIKKQKSDGMQYYLYEMIDRKHPERNSLVSHGWLWGESFFLSADFYEAINDFIVRSDFWADYYDDPKRYCAEMDDYAHTHYHYHSRNLA